MFLSKITYFVVGTVGALAIGLALTMPRPAERRMGEFEEEKLGRARSEVEMLLREDARRWVDLSSSFASYPAPAGNPKLKLDAEREGERQRMPSPWRKPSVARRHSSGFWICSMCPVPGIASYAYPKSSASARLANAGPGAPGASGSAATSFTAPPYALGGGQRLSVIACR